MNWSNYDDVVAQLASAGLILKNGIQVGTSRPVRCKIEGDREARGWYRLFELPLRSGGSLITGSYGVWRGDDNGATKIMLPKQERTALDADQLAAIKARQKEDARRAAAERDQHIERASRQAGQWWSKCLEEGESEYLVRKGLGGMGLFGARLSPVGNLVIPLQDGQAKTYGLQVVISDPKIRSKKGRDKDYTPPGLSKQGRWFQIGSPSSSGGVLLVCEGFATGASLHAATGLPVAVAFDAGNLQPVGEALLKLYRNRIRLLFCADDDYLGKCKACGQLTLVAAPTCAHCGAEHGKINTGVSRAQTAAIAVDGKWLAPMFPAERPTDRKGPTDFNDLHVHPEGGLSAVRAQVDAHLAAIGWANRSASAPATARGGRGNEVLKPLLDVDEATRRYSLIYGAGGTLFDHQEHSLVPKGDVLDILVDHGWREWKLRQDRKVVRLSEVGFDPGEQDPQIKCNLWGGWPTEAMQGQCGALLELLRYLCKEEDSPAELYHWILCWLAYPLQHPGAKMKTALVLHGPQGVGKNMFFEAVMSIYGEYGRIVDQSAVEDKFNDWASKKLFLIADEVVARQELYHVKNKLKHLITGDWIRINPKNVAAHDERNHVNLVFLSNETQPLVLERDDRRFAVIWTPAKLDMDFYRDVSSEIANGGIAALHHYLLHLDLGDFATWTNPPSTRAKRELQDLSMDSTERFWRQWVDGHLEDIPICPAKSEDFYDLYKAWCSRTGIARPAAMHILNGNLGKRPDCRKSVERYYVGASLKQATFIFPVVKPAADGKLPPGYREQPLEKKKPAWLSECAQDFAEAVQTWKGAKNGF